MLEEKNIKKMLDSKQTAFHTKNNVVYSVF